MPELQLPMAMSALRSDLGVIVAGGNEKEAVEARGKISVLDPFRIVRRVTSTPVEENGRQAMPSFCTRTHQA